MGKSQSLALLYLAAHVPCYRLVNMTGFLFGISGKDLALG